jgi:DNA-directed RNA polymerase specialized sigma24 family protein
VLKWRVMSEHPHDSSAAPAGGAAFRTTDWSMVLAAADAQSAAAEESLARLCGTYWYPIYAFIRRRGTAPAEAEDLTQDFFLHLLEKEILNGVRREKGKFRCFLLATVKNLLANDWHRKQSVKRGGRCTFIAWEESAERRYQQEPFHDQTPDRIFDQTWASVLLGAVWDKLKVEYSAGGRGLLFSTIGSAISGEKAESYAQLASRLGMTETAVAMAVWRLRKRYGELLRAEVSNTVSSPEEVENEIRCLLRSQVN